MTTCSLSMNNSSSVILASRSSVLALACPRRSCILSCIAFISLAYFVSTDASASLSLLLIARISFCAELATDSSFAFAFSTALSYFEPPPILPSNLSLAACISASLRSAACLSLSFCNCTVSYTHLTLPTTD